MKIGVYIFATASSISPIELGEALEAHGYESLFLPEHTHIPTSRKTPFRFGGELPRYYAETYDPFVALAAVAAKTERLVLGFGICLLIERDPIVVAKEVASLDVLSSGRVVLGVGAGWNQDEIENHGVDFLTRWKLLREQVEAMKAIWTEDEAEYHGELVNVERMWSWPKPLQKPHPPVLLGSNGPRTGERVLRYADGWIPNRSLSPDEVILRMSELKAAADERGVPHPLVTVFGAPPDDHAVLERYAEAGVERILLALPTAPATEVRPLVERHADLVERYGQTLLIAQPAHRISVSTACPNWRAQRPKTLPGDLGDGLREGPSWIAFARENETVYHTYTVMAPDPFVVPYYSSLLERTPKAQPAEPRTWRKDEYPD